MTESAVPRSTRRRSLTAQSARPSRGSNSLGTATRERIILAAERLFAERGIASVSLREVAEAAGQRNNAVIQYHFGDREGLLRAAIAHRATATAEIRVRMLADMLSQGREPEVHDLVAAIVLPSASQLVPNNHYLGLQARYVIERGPFHIGFGTPRLLADEPEGTWHFLREALRRKLDDLPDSLFEARWDIAVNTSILTLAGYQISMANSVHLAPLDILVADLIDVLTGALTAAARANPSTRQPQQFGSGPRILPEGQEVHS
jgi:AcrR family transcriptional regulator